jgi:hypothetical protein
MGSLVREVAMLLQRASFATVLAAALPSAVLLTHCGSSETPAGPGDAATKDATAADGSVPDTSTNDVYTSHDSATDSAGQAGDGEASVDAAIDAPIDTGPHRIPCVEIEAGAMPEAGEAGEVGDAAGADEAGEAGDAGDAGAGDDGASASDAGGGGDAGSPCPGTLSCCGGWCTDTQKDPSNCGACGNACTSGQFCTGEACDEAVVQNLCANPQATVAIDTLPTDVEAGVALGSALATGCMPAVVVVSSSVDAGVTQDPATGRPTTGPGDTLVAGGGHFGQASVAYMENNHLATLQAGGTPSTWWLRNTKTNTDVFNVPSSSINAGHDYVVLEVSVEPISGSLCFFGYGFTVGGTAAAAYFFQTNVVGNLSAFPDAWYVYEWTDADHTGTPSAGDTFTPVAHGM